MKRRFVGALRDQRAAAMEVLLLAEKARRAILACEELPESRIAAIMEAITWANPPPLSRGISRRAVFGFRFHVSGFRRGKAVS